jgi:hypothetical protein
MTEHASWLVSVTPKNNGSFITPGGQRFDITMHDGFTAEMVTAAIAELDKAAAFLLPANGIPGPKAQPRQDAASDEAPQNSGAGEEVFSVGWVNCGDEFIAEVARLVPAASGKKQHAEVYTPHSKYPLTRIDERFFAAIKQATGSDLTFGEEVTFDPPREIVFKLSHKNKQNSDRHYIDFVRVYGSSSAPAAAKADDGEAIDWGKVLTHATGTLGYKNRAAVVKVVGEFDEWTGSKAELNTLLTEHAPKAKTRQ